MVQSSPMKTTSDKYSASDMRRTYEIHHSEERWRATLGYRKTSCATVFDSKHETFITTLMIHDANGNLNFVNFSCNHINHHIVLPNDARHYLEVPLLLIPLKPPVHPGLYHSRLYLDMR